MDEPRRFIHQIWSIAPRDLYINWRLLGNDRYQAINMFRTVDAMLNITDGGLTWLHQKNAEYNIHPRIALSAAESDSKAAITCVTALWVDIDEINDDTYTSLERMFWPPSILIHSGGGYHAYWLLRQPLFITDERIRERVERINEGLAVAAMGDVACKNINRLMRIPGFMNIKPKYGADGAAIRYIYDDNYRYRFEHIANQYEHLGAATAPRVRRSMPVVKFDEERLPRWVADYLATGAREGERNQRLYAAARAYNDHGVSEGRAISELGARGEADGLSTQEVENAIRSAYRAPRNPVAAIPSHMRNHMAVEDNKRR